MSNLPVYHNGDKFGASDINAIIDEIERIEEGLVGGVHIVSREIKEYTTGYKRTEIITKYSDGTAELILIEPAAVETYIQTHSGFYASGGGIDISMFDTVKAISIDVTTEESQSVTYNRTPITGQIDTDGSYMIWSPVNYSNVKIRKEYHVLGTYTEEE